MYCSLYCQQQNKAKADAREQHSRRGGQQRPRGRICWHRTYPVAPAVGEVVAEVCPGGGDGLAVLQDTHVVPVDLQDDGAMTGGSATASVHRDWRVGCLLGWGCLRGSRQARMDQTDNNNGNLSHHHQEDR